MLRLSFLGTTLLAAAASAQLIPTTLPACAQQCSVLIGAQNSCVSNPAAEASCFCQNADLAPIRSAPSNNLCSAWCSPTDWTTIANWYNQQACPNGQVGSIGSTMATVITTSAAATPASSSGALSGTGGAGGTAEPSATGSFASAAAAATGSVNSGSSSQTNASDYKNGSEWWATHYQWIIMVIVLLVAFLVLGIGGRILFRRHQRRRNMGGVSGRGTDWAPNSTAHDFDTQGRQALAAAGPVTDEKTDSKRKGKTLTRKLTGQ